MGRLTKEQILRAADIRTEEVDVPEWGGTVVVRGLTGKDRDMYEMSIVDLAASTPGNIVTHTENIRAKLASLSIIDEAGDLMFSEQDVEALTEKSAAALDRVVEVTRRLSGLTASAEKDAVKNLKSGQNDGSTSA